MYDFELSFGTSSPENGAASLWSGAAAPAIDFFRHRIGSGNIRFFRPDSSGRWNESLGTLHRYKSEIFFQVQGSCAFTFPTETLEIIPGDVLLVPLGMPHLEFAEDREGKRFFNLVLTVSEGWTTLHIGALGSRPSPGKPVIILRRVLPNALFYRGVVTALSQFPSSVPGRYSAARAALLEAMLCQMAEDLAADPEPEIPDDAPYSFARRAKIKLDEENRAAELDVGGLAAELGCSPGYLSHSFHRLYGMPLKLYIRALRLEYARQLLASGDCNVAETAERCGFRDASYFSRQFRQRFGVAPGKLR